MVFIWNLDITVCPDLSLQHVGVENKEAVPRRCRAIKVRLAGSEICTREVSGRVA
jgi:hypothetical protein